MANSNTTPEPKPAGGGFGGNNGILHQLERKAAIASVTPERHTALRKAAEMLNRSNMDAAVVEVLNEALSRLVLLCYVTDAGGWANIDRTGRILIPTPMGRNGQKHWGLRPSEANVLRAILFTWQETGISLLRYDRSRRAWFVETGTYGASGIAKAWLRANPITIATYRITCDKLAQRR